MRRTASDPVKAYFVPLFVCVLPIRSASCFHRRFVVLFVQKKVNKSSTSCWSPQTAVVVVHHLQPVVGHFLKKVCHASASGGYANILFRKARAAGAAAAASAGGGSTAVEPRFSGSTAPLPISTGLNRVKPLCEVPDPNEHVGMWNGLALLISTTSVHCGLVLPKKKKKERLKRIDHKKRRKESRRPGLEHLGRNKQQGSPPPGQTP